MTCEVIDGAMPGAESGDEPPGAGGREDRQDGGPDVEHERLVDDYFAVWNETDEARRRELVARAWTEDATYVDPLMRGDGHEGIAAMVGGVQAHYPGFRFRRAGAVDGYGDRVRFGWEFGPEGSPAVAGGLDVGEVVGGRLREVVGFLDFAPVGDGS